jgi:hypothetical protein
MKKLFIILAVVVVAVPLIAQTAADSTNRGAIYSRKFNEWVAIEALMRATCTQRGGGVDTMFFVYSCGSTTYRYFIPGISNSERLAFKNNGLDTAKAWKRSYKDSVTKYTQ